MWHAHIAMQQAKSTQGCTFHIFNERINRNARSIADLESELRRALRRDELELHYQPRLCLTTGQMSSASKPWCAGVISERGLLPPSEFVPLGRAERFDRAAGLLGDFPCPARHAGAARAGPAAAAHGDQPVVPPVSGQPVAGRPSAA
jgi:predicted signal transduction protein with EAL and GGDEF domain